MTLTKCKQYRSCPALALALVFLTFLAGARADEKLKTYEKVDVHGKVSDEQNKPLPHVKVCLSDQVTGEQKTASTNREGFFQVSSPFSHPLSLEIEPPHGSGLAQAFFENLPARQDRQLFVHLAKGFPVNGRITFSGTALKGIEVKALPQNPESEHEQIYGGGKTVTDGSGKFNLILTPGRKLLFVENRRYTNVARETKRSITVTADTKLGDVTLPSPQ
jgi:hypothetical protein